MLIEFIEDYAGKKVGQKADMEASVARTMILQKVAVKVPEKVDGNAPAPRKPVPPAPKKPRNKK